MPRLLLVDDNSSIHRIVVFLLKSTDIEVAYARSASEAFELISETTPFDLALIDTSLPDLDGWELLSRLRADPKTASMPIAMMSGVLEEVDSSQVENAPIQAFLRKPIDLRNLAERVESLISTPVEADEPVPQPETSIPSDLLILEEQDLAAGEAETKSSEEETLATPSAPSSEAQIAEEDDDGKDDNEEDDKEEEKEDKEETEEDEEETEEDEEETEDDDKEKKEEDVTLEPPKEEISLELKDLDLSELDQLVVDSDAPAAEQEEKSIKQPDPDDSPLTALPTPVIESDNFEEKSAQIPADFFDTLPGDFDLSLLSEDTPTNPLPALESNADQDGRNEQSPHAYTDPYITTELLADPEFIDALAKAVAEKLEKKL